jgi:hypothetical protein
MNIDELTPAGASLRTVLNPAASAEPVATFTATPTPDPAELWAPFTKPTSMTSDGTQGNPLGSFRPGHGLEHESANASERMAQHVAQTVARDQVEDGQGDDAKPYRFSHAETARAVRSALRPGVALR